VGPRHRGRFNETLLVADLHRQTIDFRNDRLFPIREQSCRSEGTMKPQVGQRITAPFLSAPAEVKTFEERPGYYLLEVVLDDGHQSYRSLNLSEDQLAQVEVADRPAMALGDGIDARDFFLIEAHRIRLAYQFDPQLASGGRLCGEPRLRCALHLPRRGWELRRRALRRGQGARAVRSDPSVVERVEEGAPLRPEVLAVRGDGGGSDRPELHRIQDPAAHFREGRTSSAGL
jgi:hypothetical protein